MLPVEPELPSNEGPSAPTGASDLVRRAAFVGLVASVAPLPFQIAMVGPSTAMMGVVAGLAFLAVLWRSRRGELGKAATWLVATCVIGVGGAHFAYGGFAGWTFTLVAILPMLAILVDTGGRSLGTSVAFIVLGMLGLSYALPDAWWLVDPPSDSTTWWMRVVTALLSTVAAGIVATHAVRRLEQAMATAKSTERRARWAVERKTAFLANISHELRTPMNAILGYSELVIEDDAISELGRGDVRRIRESGGHLLGLIGDVLRVARLDASGSEVRESCEVSSMIERWVAGSGRRLERTGEVPAAGAMVEVDPRILDHLVQNVVEGYRRRGATQVGVTAKIAGGRAVVTFEPAASAALDEPVPLVWELARRSARSGRLSFESDDAGRITLVIPLRGRGRTVRPPETITELRGRLAVRSVWLSLATIAVVAPISVALDGGRESVLLGITAWVALLGSILVVYWHGWLRSASLGVAVGQIGALTVVQSLCGGPTDAGMVYFAIVTVVAVFVLGSRPGYLVTGLAAACIVLMAAADGAGWLPAASPDPREMVAFVTAVATVVSASLVAMLSNSLERLVTSVRDAARRASEADRSTNQFLDAVSTGLRTPLNAILGYAELLVEDHQHQPQLREDLVRIVRAGRHLLRLVDDLLDMAAIVADQLALETEVVELSEVVAAVLEKVRPLAESRGNALEFAHDPRVETVLADPERLRQILTNLLANAAKFTDHGRLVVRVTRPDDGPVVIAVEDTGIGILADDVRKLFEPFRQVHRRSPGEYGGTGIGLAISRRLARKMGGDITVRSELGEGSVFSLLLPAGPPAEVSQPGAGAVSSGFRRAGAQL